MLTKHKHLKFLLKDTIRDYFCERNVFFYTTTLSSLFHLFSIYKCVLLIDVFSGCSLVEIKKTIGQVKECQEYSLENYP